MMCKTADEASEDTVKEEEWTVGEECEAEYTNNLDSGFSTDIDSSTRNSKDTSDTDNIGYTTDHEQSTLAAPTQVSFQELLDEAHAAILNGSESHNVVDNLMDTHIRTGPLPSPAVTPTLFCCEICAKTFTQLWILDRHYNTSHGFSGRHGKTCKVCGKVVEPGSKHACYDCTHCVMKFQSKSALRDHVLLQHTKTSKKCDICGEEFTSHQHLVRHMIECRLRKGPELEKIPNTTECKRCHKSLKSFTHYHKHEQNFNSLSHKCLVCQKGFCTFFELFAHTWREHHKENRYNSEYTCPVCEEVFSHFRYCSYHIYDMHEGNSHSTDSMWKTDLRLKERKYLYSKERYWLRKYGVENEVEQWSFEGEFVPYEAIEKEEFTRSSARIEQKNDDTPTMVAKKSKIEFLSLPPRTNKPRKKGRNTIINKD